MAGVSLRGLQPLLRTELEKRQAHVERAVMEHEKVCVTGLLPTFSLTQVPVQE